MRKFTGLAVTALIALGSGAATPAVENSSPPCEIGVYRLSDGSLVDIGPGDDGLRWRTLDGRTGKLSKDPSGRWLSFLGWAGERDGTSIAFGPCGSGKLAFNGKPGRSIKLQQIETTFKSGSETLVEGWSCPRDRPKCRLWSWVTGPSEISAVAGAFRQRLYPAAGVGVFVFDKRGTGKSTGKYTQDFDLLATDAAAAMREARRLAGRHATRFGFQGGSQAGWILPLAAQKASADFVIVGYGVAASPLIEDRTETLQDLAAAGWGADVLAKAAEVTDATGAVMASDFTSGFDRLSAAVAQYGKEPWFKDLKGEFTGEIVKYPEAILRVEGPKHDEGTSWEFDAMASLRSLRAPLLWLIAGEDTGGAGDETKRNLLSFQSEGHSVTVLDFPKTEHGIHLVRTAADGKREEIGYHPHYFQAELDFAKTGRVQSSYGDVEVHLP